MNLSKPLEYGSYYHIFNKGINDEDIFTSNDNYEHFLKLYSEYIEPVADTFAWALLKNHFHLLVRIKHDKEIPYMPNIDEKTGEIHKNPKKYKPSKQFSHLFNAYAKAFNKRNKRTGGLFQTPFKRIKIDNYKYFKHLVWYIHYNPVKHRFAESILDYPWTSYLTIISINPTKLKREKVIGWFDSTADFKTYHNNIKDIGTSEAFIIE